ncbi:MAG: hypothetical protein GF364_08320 [Candidatus Lokiarchaeota archaeon]|nr:hypothetical protein [Candidatus Lokiarchaeota archaeon]
MLKNILIMNDRLVYLNKDFAYSFKNENALIEILKLTNKEMEERAFYDENMVIDMLTIKSICRKYKESNLFLALTFDDSIDPKNDRYKKAVDNLLQATLDYIKETNSEEKLNNPNNLVKKSLTVVDDLMSFLPPKISIIGYDQTGKTNIAKLVLEGKVPEKYIETTGLETYEGKLFDFPLLIWEISDDVGEDLWSKYIKASDALVVVLDSTMENAKETKNMIEKTAKDLPHAELLIVANKQDKEDALIIEQMEKTLGYKVFPFSANKEENAKLIQEQVAKLIELKSEHLDYSTESYVVNRND